MWYWEALVYQPEATVNLCGERNETVTAMKVKEAWWDNFSGKGVWSGLSSGDIGTDGLPTGHNVRFFRTVWHAEGQTPYYKIGSPEEDQVYWCMDRKWDVQ